MPTFETARSRLRSKFQRPKKESRFSVQGRITLLQMGFGFLALVLAACAQHYQESDISKPQTISSEQRLYQNELKAVLNSVNDVNAKVAFGMRPSLGLHSQIPGK